MRTIAILSDLHGNSGATAAVLADIDAVFPDEKESPKSSPKE